MSKPLPRYVIHVVVPYAVCAALWVFLSNHLLDILVTNAEWRASLQTYKGLTFVAVTSLLLFALLQRRQIRSAHVSFEQKRLRDRIFGILETMTDGFIALDRDWNYQYVNQRAGEFLGRDPSDLIGKNIWQEFPEGVDRNFYHAYRRVMSTQQAETIEEYYPRWQRWFENRIFPSTGGLHIFFQEITARKRAEAWREGRSQVLAQIVAEHPLQGVLETLLYSIESQVIHAFGSIMLLDADGQHLHYGAGPTLPPGLDRAIENMKIGPLAGACGTAAFTREMVIIEDFQTDPRSIDYRALAQQFNLRACWSQPIFSAFGHVLGTFAMYYTEPRTPLLTERKLIEEAGHLAAVAIEAARHRAALKASEEHFRTIFEQATDGILIADATAKFLDANNTFCQMLGYSREDLLNLDLEDIVDPTDLLRLAPAIANLKIQGTVRSEWRLRRQDGAALLVEVTSKVLTDGRLQGFVRDITEHRKAEAALQEREEILRLFVEHSPAAIGMLDQEMRYVVASQRWKTDFGLGTQNIIGRSHYDAFPDTSQHWRDIHQRCLAGATERCDEDRFVRADGGIEWVKCEICPWRKSDGNIGGIVIFSEVVTERKQAALKIAQDAKSLAHLSRQLLAAQETERRHIARELHDEVGQLLTVVKLDLQTVLRQAQSKILDATLRDGMESIDRVIARVRDLSLDLRPSMLDDFGLVPALRWLAQRQAKHLDAGIDLDLPLHPPRLSGSVETACFRIVQEALTNIARHANARTIQVALTLYERDIELSVKDDGIGFDLIATRSPDHPGTGFGLLGMRERAELAGGEFEIITVPGQGCKVMARFPWSTDLDQKEAL